MKKLFAWLLAAALLLGLTACFGGSEDKPTTTLEPAQTTTEAPETVPMPTADPDIEYTTQVVDAKSATDFDAEALCKRLEGVWNDNYEIPGFMSFIYKNGKPSLYVGAYDGETSGIGTLTGGSAGANDEGIAMLYFLYPAIEDWPGPLPERTDALQIDLAGIDGGALRIQYTTIWSTGEWNAFTYRCKTLQEAGIRATF